LRPRPGALELTCAHGDAPPDQRLDILKFNFEEWLRYRDRSFRRRRRARFFRVTNP